MRGSIVKRGAGYAVVVELDRDPVSGKRRQKWHSGYRTKRDAEKALGELVNAVHGGTFIEPSKQTFAEYLTEWLAAIEPTIRPATQHSYARNVRLHVVPRLGGVQLRRLDAAMLNGLYAVLLADGKRSHAGGGLSPRTVRYVPRSFTAHCGTRCAGDACSATRLTTTPCWFSTRKFAEKPTASSTSSGNPK